MQLFSNGMMESEQRHVTLRINASGMLSGALGKNYGKTTSSA